MEYLKRFLLGSSFSMLIPLYMMMKLWSKTDFIKNKIVYDIDKYFITAPIFIGLWNVISFVIGKYLGWSLEERIFVFSIISYICTITLITVLRLYKFTKLEWIIYCINTFIGYMILWNVLIYNIEIMFMK